MYSAEEIKQEMDNLSWKAPDDFFTNNPKDDPVLYRAHTLLNPYSINDDETRCGQVHATPSPNNLRQYMNWAKLSSCYNNFPEARGGFISVFRPSKDNLFIRDEGAADMAMGHEVAVYSLDNIESFDDAKHFETALIAGENPRVGLYIFRNNPERKNKRFNILIDCNEIDVCEITPDMKIYKMLLENEKEANGGYIDLASKYEPDWESLETVMRNRDIRKFEQKQESAKQTIKAIDDERRISSMSSMNPQSIAIVARETIKR